MNSSEWPISYRTILILTKKKKQNKQIVDSVGYRDAIEFPDDNENDNCIEQRSVIRQIV